MPIVGQETIARNIVKFGGGFLRHVNVTMEQARKILDDQVSRNISLTDHSLAELARMGHPYSAKYGPQGIPIHDPYWQIHKQSGKLLKSKYSEISEARITGGKLQASASVGLDEGKAEHAPFVIFGTSRMIPRDVLRQSLTQVQDKVYGIIKRNLRDAVLAFRAE